ncbi:MAG: TRAP transporter substrate-binding protein DctP [Candidatus Aminicenantales bacterium]
MSAVRRLVLVVLALLVSSTGLRATVIKIGTVVPERSPWDIALRDIAAEWFKISNGTVDLKIYPGGIAGSEQEMLRMMRLGTLDGVIVTNIGVTHLNPNLYVLNIPFLLNSREEFEYLMGRMEPAFVKPLEDKGIKVVLRVLAGWLYFFANEKFIYPEDFRKFRISLISGEPRLEEAFKAMGYRVIPIDIKDMMMALQSGMVTAIYFPPLIAASAQFFALAPHMLDLPASLMAGWFLLNESTWERIPESYREPMEKAVLKAAEGLLRKTNELEAEVFKVMKENGLIIHEAPADAWDRWRVLSLKAIDKMVGGAYPREIYDQAVAILEEFRKAHGR